MFCLDNLLHHIHYIPLRYTHTRMRRKNSRSTPVFTQRYHSDLVPPCAALRFRHFRRLPEKKKNMENTHVTPRQGVTMSGFIATLKSFDFYRSDTRPSPLATCHPFSLFLFWHVGYSSAENPCAHNKERVCVPIESITACK
jgi:hypothetical protein